MRQQRLQLGREGECLPVAPIVERLHAEPVAREQQLATPPIPEREGEHPVQPLQTRAAPLLVRVQDDLAIAARAKVMSGPLQCWRQLAKVVDLAVEDKPERAVFVRHRLVARRAEVEDGEAREPKAHARLQVAAHVVRPTVALCRHHAPHHRLAHAVLAAQIERATDTTHRLASPLSSPNLPAPRSRPPPAALPPTGTPRPCAPRTPRRYTSPPLTVQPAPPVAA